MSRHIQERVKIIATVGPASLKPGVLQKLIKDSVDAIRINGSHAEPEEIKGLVTKIRSASRQVHRDAAILLDLPGPKYRIGELARPLELEEGGTIALAARAADGEIPISFRGIVKSLKKGDDVFLDDGFVRLHVDSVGKNRMVCTVMQGGTLTSRAGFNLPGVPVRTPIPTKRDLEHLKAGVAAGVDLFALSFVQRPRDLERCREHAGGIPMIAKIERPEAVAAIDAIATASDGIMVARGDLAVEMQPEQLPVLQKRLIKAANRARKPVIVATEMLASMVHAPRPTRAELTDVGNAVLDGADAVMLSEETAIGDHPHRVVRVMSRILQTVESSLLEYDIAVQTDWGHNADRPDWAVADAAVETAFHVGAQAIVAVTGSGRTARLIASRRPSVPLFAFTPDAAVRRRVALMWGVVARPIRPLASPERVIEEILGRLRKDKDVAKGDLVVISYGSPVWKSGTKTNTLRIVEA